MKINLKSNKKKKKKEPILLILESLVRPESSRGIVYFQNSRDTIDPRSAKKRKTTRRNGRINSNPETIPRNLVPRRTRANQVGRYPPPAKLCPGSVIIRSDEQSVKIGVSGRRAMRKRGARLGDKKILTGMQQGVISRDGIR